MMAAWPACSDLMLVGFMINELVSLGQVYLIRGYSGVMWLEVVSGVLTGHKVTLQCEKKHRKNREKNRLK